MKRKTILILVCASTFAVLNFGFDAYNNSHSGNLSVNMSALKSSASEIWCDPSTNNPCSIQGPGGSWILGVGQPKAEW